MVNRFAFVLGLCAVASIAFSADPSNFSIKMEKVAGTEDQVMVYGAWTIGEIQGWSFGVCHNSAEATIGTCGSATFADCAAAAAGCANLECPTDILTAKAGAPPNFASINLFTGGVTQGVVIDFMQLVSLNVDDRFEFLKIKYTLIAASTALSFCNTLGSPNTDTVYVWGGGSFAPAVQEGVTLGSVVEPCELTMSLATKGASGVAVSLETGENQAVTGFSFGVADANANIIVTSIDPGAASTAVMGGALPEYWEDKAVTGGATLGCVFSLGAQVKALPACTADQEIAVVTYLNSGATQETANVTLSGTLGSPAVPVVVDVDGVSFDPIVGGGVSITLPGGATPPFVRGDVNQDHKLNVSDGVAIARYVFGLGSQKAKIDNCKDSADADDDGSISGRRPLRVGLPVHGRPDRQGAVPGLRHRHDGRSD